MDINNNNNNSSLYRYDGFDSYFYRGLQFFSSRKQKHYKVLNKYTFSILSGNLIRIKETHHQIGDSFSYYEDLIPENSYKYADALEHMKKDKSQKRLDELIKEYQDHIRKINETITRNGDLILDQISSACGVDSKLERIKLGEICTFLNQALSHVKDDEDIRNARSHGYTFSKEYKEVIECANKLLEDEIILESYDEIRRDYRELKEIATKVQQKASSISQAINDEDYDVNAKCCPSYITIIKDLINYD